MGLKDYTAKRDFTKTPEPEPGRRTKGKRLAFVVQKHAARAVHYDLRLEMEGVLKSWAIPKGPTLNPSTKRLAVMVEDHPLDYLDFEGVIPENNYGAGSVIIWDRGFYRHPSDPDGLASEPLLTKGLETGDLKFVLQGEKLHGEFALVKMHTDQKSWLLLKKKDRFVTSEDILKKNRSVASSKTLEDITEENPNKTAKRERIKQIRSREAVEKVDLKDAPIQPMPHGIKPMLATLVKEPFDHPDWLFEVKWDGYRAIAEIDKRGVSLYSRNLLSFNKKFSPVVVALEKLRLKAVLDGEIVVVDEQGQPDFQMLQDYQKSGEGHLLYYVFDLLHFEGHDLTNLPLAGRKEFLQKIIPDVRHVRFSDHVWNDGILFFKVAQEKGLEGIVAKHGQSHYRIGRRSSQWLKVKARLTQEGVIAGFTAPRGTRGNFGALVMGVFENNELVYIGHTGSGFSAEALKEIHARLRPLIQNECPFKVEPQTNMPVTWVKPLVVAECIFHGWTDEGLMRQPVFLRLREDKDAREVEREKSRN